MEQSKSRKSPTAFTLPNYGDEEYYLASDVSACLEMKKHFFNSFPHLWKRPLTAEEKIYLTEIGVCERRTTSYLVKAVEVRKRVMHKFPHMNIFGLSKANMFNESLMNNDDKSAMRSKFSLDSNSGLEPLSVNAIEMGNSVVSSANGKGQMSRTPVKKLKELKLKIKASDLNIPSCPIETIGEKPTSFVYKSAEGSDIERYYTSNDIFRYTNRKFSMQTYPLLWRKCYKSSELSCFNVPVSNGNNKMTTIFRVRDIDEILQGYHLKFTVPIKEDNTLQSYKLGDDDECYYLANFVAQATKTKFLHNYKLYKRVVTKADKSALRKQGVYGVCLTWIILKASEVDELLAGRGEKYYSYTTPTLSAFGPLLSRSLLRKAKNTKLNRLKLAAPTVRNSRDNNVHKWSLQDGNTHHVNTMNRKESTSSENSAKGVDIKALKDVIIRDFVKMCVGARVPLTFIENDSFRVICQKFLDIGREITLKSPDKAVNVNSILPSYKESRDFIDNQMVSARDASIAEAHAIAVSGGIAVSIYSNAFTKSHNLVLATLHFITTDWVLKTVSITPIEVPVFNECDAGIHIKRQVLNAVGIASNTAAAEIIFPLNCVKTEYDNEPSPKRCRVTETKGIHMNGNGTAENSVCTTQSSFFSFGNENIHFVMNNLFGNYFKDLSRETIFTTSASVTRCIARYISVLKWKVNEKFNMQNSEELQRFNSRLFAPILESIDTLKKNELPTINHILPIVCEWIRHFEGIISSEENVQLRTMAEDILVEFRTTYEKHFNKDLFYFALILDPSQKNKIREYLPDKQKKKELTERFKTIVTSYRTLYASTEKSSRTQILDSFFDDDDVINEDDVEKEIVSYLSKPSVEFSSTSEMKLKAETETYANILEYWRRNENKFPNCARLARKVLSIPVLAERDVFSQVFLPVPTNKLDTEVLRIEAQAKNIVDLGILLSMDF